MNARADERIEGDPSSHPVWRDDESALLATRRILRWRARRSAASTSCTSPRRRAGIYRPAQGHRDLRSHAAASDAGRRGGLSAPRHAGADEPADPFGRASRRAVALAEPGRARRHRLGPCAAHAGGKGHTPYPGSPSGMPGVQTLLPLLLDHAANGRLSLQRFIELTSAGAQRIFGIVGKGRIAAWLRRRLHHRRPQEALDDRGPVAPVQVWLVALHGHGADRKPIGTIIRARSRCGKTRSPPRRPASRCVSRRSISDEGGPVGARHPGLLPGCAPDAGGDDSGRSGAVERDATASVLLGSCAPRRWAISGVIGTWWNWRTAMKAFRPGDGAVPTLGTVGEPSWSPTVPDRHLWRGRGCGFAGEPVAGRTPLGRAGHRGQRALSAIGAGIRESPYPQDPSEGQPPRLVGEVHIADIDARAPTDPQPHRISTTLPRRK